MLITENAERCRVEQEMLRLCDRQPNPPGGEDAAKMAVREECDVPIQHAESCNEAVRTGGNLGRRFTVRRAVTKEIPVRSRREYVVKGPSFVVSIVPLREVRFYFRCRRQPGQRTRLLSAHERAGQHMRKWDVTETLSEFARCVLAVRGQRNVRATGVLAGE